MRDEDIPRPSDNRRTMQVGFLFFQRTHDPGDGFNGLWKHRSDLVPPERREWIECESVENQIMDRLAHLEDALVSKAKELQGSNGGNVSIIIDDDKRTLLATGVPLVLDNNGQFITLTWES